MTAAREFDYLMARRMIVPHREIAAASLEDYWRQWDSEGIAEEPASAPATLIEEFGELYDGEAVLRLPDGSRWACVSALFSLDLHEGGPADNVFLRHLWALLLEHTVLSEACHGPRLDIVMLHAATLDPRRGFCTEPRCRQWMDLEADADKTEREVMRGERGPWEFGDGNYSRHPWRLKGEWK
jgi:hypothetical protein